MSDRRAKSHICFGLGTDDKLREARTDTSAPNPVSAARGFFGRDHRREMPTVCVGHARAGRMPGSASFRIPNHSDPMLLAPPSIVRSG